jgi:pSer/pThr/pTyr-binding forkhead associated (FHA) protein
MPRIQYTTPDGNSGEVELTAESMTIGRADDNAIVIYDDSMSSHHGELSFDGAEWTFTDLGSTNGTKVHGERVEQFSLGQYPSFTLGSVECQFIGDFADQEAAAAYTAGATASTMSLDGYAAIPYDGSLRTGFGPKTKLKGQGAGGLIFFGVLGLIACAAAIFLFSSMAG